MNTQPIVVEQDLNAPVHTVWNALTCPDDMSHWFYIIDHFEPKVGYKFKFYSGGEEQKYEHVCRVLEAVKNEKLTYCWEYADVEGDSIVSYELTKINDNSTHIKLTHIGTATFPQHNRLFSRRAFEKGWKELISISLKEYVESKHT